MSYNSTELENSVASNISERIDNRFEKNLDTEIMRQKIIQIFNEQTEQVEFAKKIKKYAGEEMDKRLFRSAKYWGVVISTAILTSIITFFITFFLPKLIH